MSCLPESMLLLLLLLLLPFMLRSARMPTAPWVSTCCIVCVETVTLPGWLQPSAFLRVLWTV
jgi:hypothetical protein